MAGIALRVFLHPWTLAAAASLLELPDSDLPKLEDFLGAIFKHQGEKHPQPA